MFMNPCRLGAAQALTRCAPDLGKQATLVQDFYLQALSYCVRALQLAEHDPEGTGTKGASEAAIYVSAATEGLTSHC